VIRRRIGPVKAASADGTAAVAAAVPTGRGALPADSGGNGSGSGSGEPTGAGTGGGLGARILARANQQRRDKPAESESKVSTPQTRSSRPPQSPRKKKKRSGRRR
ncbi:MAG TPA: hypothetical protein VF830_07440, partial [Gemmatimonadales bacterium]